MAKSFYTYKRVLSGVLQAYFAIADAVSAKAGNPERK